MASFAAQAALRAKWSSLVEEHTIEVPAEVTSKVTSVVGWLKQVNIIIRCSGISTCTNESLNNTGLLTLSVLHDTNFYLSVNTPQIDLKIRRNAPHLF